MASLIVKGGWVMVPIILSSIVAMAFVLERTWFFWAVRLDTEDFAKKIFGILKQAGPEEALAACHKERHPVAQVFAAGLEHAGETAPELDRVMEREGGHQVQIIERNLNYLMVVIGIAPLLGFLGTILGLIRAFMAWEKLSTSVTVGALAAGIYQAMITTAAGLIVAIPYFIIYNVFLSKTNQITHEMNHYGDELVGILAKKAR